MSLESGDPAAPISHAVRYPAGLPTSREPAARIGLEAIAAPSADGSVTITVRTALLAYGVRVQAPGFVAEDDCFSLEPGGERRLRLVPLAPDTEFSGATVSALNAHGTVRVK
jgi:hypothetical protein